MLKNYLLTSTLGICIIKIPSILVKKEKNMNREEILAKSRKDYEKNDEYLVDALTKAGKISSQVGLIVTAIIVAGDQFVFNTYNYGAQAIYFAIMGTMNIVRYKYIKEKKDLVLGIFFAIGSVLSLVAHFKSFI